MARHSDLTTVDLPGGDHPRRDKAGSKPQTLRLSEKALRGLRIRAAVYNTTQAALADKAILEYFERHPLPSHLIV